MRVASVEQGEETNKNNKSNNNNNNQDDDDDDDNNLLSLGVTDLKGNKNATNAFTPLHQDSIPIVLHCFAHYSQALMRTTLYGYAHHIHDDVIASKERLLH